MEYTLTLTAADGFQLCGTKFEATGKRRGTIIVASATAVPQGFYRRFAEHARQRGFTVLTFDYRGSGRSRPGDLRGFRMDFRDWGRLDLAAAVEAMAQEGGPLYVVGHSYGGHAIGLLPNHHLITRAYAFGVGAGWHGWMPPIERLKIRLLWGLLLPILNAIKGYTPMSWLGLGEDLPLDATNSWRRWCGFPRYFFDDPELPGMAEQFATVTAPIAFANALDDLWALPRSREAFVWSYASAPLTLIDIDPKRFPGGLGHMGYFRAKGVQLWDEALDWLTR
jgi:predicted alpha/beta hydrolase